MRRRVFRSHTSEQQQQGQQVETRRRLLGTLAPGTTLALPLGWDAEGSELQVRPLLPDPRVCSQGDSPSECEEAEGLERSASHMPLLLDQYGQALHSWGVCVGSRAGLGVGLAELQEGATHLLSCCIPPDATTASLATPSTQQQTEAQQISLASLLQSHWLSVTVECDALVMSQVGGVGQMLVVAHTGGSCIRWGAKPVL